MCIRRGDLRSPAGEHSPPLPCSENILMRTLLKTTLLNMIGGLDTPSCGEVYVTGKCITTMKERELSRFSAYSKRAANAEVVSETVHGAFCGQR